MIYLLWGKNMGAGLLGSNEGTDMSLTRANMGTQLLPEKLCVYSTVNPAAPEGGARVSIVRSHSERSPKATSEKNTKFSCHITSSVKLEC